MHPRSFGRFFLPLIGGLLIAGCSTLKLAYNNADFVGTWIADSHFDLTSVQKKELDASLERILEWHRREELPNLIRWLENAKSELDHGLTVAAIDSFFKQAQLRYETFIDMSADEGTVFFKGLTDEQITHLEDKSRKDSAEFVEDHLLNRSLEQRKARRWERTRKFLKDWIGNLSDEQETEFSKMSYALPMTQSLWFENRIRRRKEFVTLLRTKRNSPEFKQVLVEWFKDSNKSPSIEYETAVREMMNRSFKMAVDISSRLSEKQKERALKRLQGYIDDLKALHKRAGTE